MVRYVTALAMLITGASVADGQQLWLAAVQGQSGHWLLGNPLGPSAGVTWPLRGPVGLRLGVHSLTHAQTRVGTACGGFIIDPSECPVERIDDRTSLTGVTLDLTATVLRRGRVSLTLMPSVSFIGATAKSRGQQTGNTLDASESMVGLGGGAALSVVPHAQWPVALQLGGHVEMLSGGGAPVVDGYSPFAAGFRFARIELSVAVWKPRRAAPVTAPR